MKVLTENRKAYHDYHILDVYDAGIILFGYEVKQIRNGDMSLVGSHITIKNNIVLLHNSYVKPNASYSYEQDSKRVRVLLLNQSEINKLVKHIELKGNTCIPLDIHVNDRGYIKIKIGLAKGKNAPDKRAAEKDKDLKRQIKEEV